MFHSVHVGVDDVDHSQYPEGFDFSLPGAVASANLLMKLMADLGADHQTILRNPSVAEVLSTLSGISSVSRPGDLIVFTFAGHGAALEAKYAAASHFPDSAKTLTLAKDPNFEVTALMRDRMMLADEYARAIKGFPAGVRYINIIDSCCSGTLYTELLDNNTLKVQYFEAPPAMRMKQRDAPLVSGDDPPGPNVFTALYDFKKDEYLSVEGDPGPLHVSGIHFAACKAGATTQYIGAYGDFSNAIDVAMRTLPRPDTYILLNVHVCQTMLGVSPDTVLVPFGSAQNDALASSPFDPN